MGFGDWETESTLQLNLTLDTDEIQNRNEFSFITNKLNVSYFTQIEKIRIKLPESARKDFKSTIDFISKVSILSPA
jgi:hypothetical protein